MSKVKSATIRGEGIRDCPFALAIPNGCRCAGKAVERMAPILDKNTPEENEQLAKANKLVFAYHKEDKNCIYADKILEDYDKVDCDFGDTGQGLHSVPFVGSPLYPQSFSGGNLDGLHSFPLGYYSDNDSSRNLFLGLFSLLGYTSREELIKLADNYDKSGEKEKADTLDELLNKLTTIKEEYKETFDKIESYLNESRTTYNNKEVNPALLYDLYKKWFEIRQQTK